MIVYRFRFMRRNHPRFGAQIPGRRYDRNAAGTVMYSMTAASIAATAAAAAAAVVRLLRLAAHVLGGNSSGHESIVTTVVSRFLTTMLLLLMGQRDHVVGSLQRLMVSGSGGCWNPRMMVMVAVVVDPRSLGWYVRWWHTRQVRQMGRWWWWVAHVLWWGGMSVHHPGCPGFV